MAPFFHLEVANSGYIMFFNFFVEFPASIRYNGNNMMKGDFFHEALNQPA